MGNDMVREERAENAKRGSHYGVALPMQNVDKNYLKRECMNCHIFQLTKVII